VVFKNKNRGLIQKEAKNLTLTLMVMAKVMAIGMISKLVINQISIRKSKCKKKRRNGEGLFTGPEHRPKYSIKL
jgi:hypothetical protein